MFSNMRILNRIASEQLRFDTLYRVPSTRKSFPGHSPKVQLAPKAGKTPSKVIFSPVKPQLSLSQLAHLATREDFEIYPDLRSSYCSSQMFGTRKHEFLSVRMTKKVDSESDLASLKELNRMARLFELTSHSKHVSIYPESPKLSKMLSHDRVSHMIIAELLRFTVNGFAVDDFSLVFPKTQRPHTVMFSGHPRIERNIFNQLLASKLSELRSRLGVSQTPVGSVSLVSSWINRLLNFKTKTVQAKKMPVPEQKGKKKTSPSVQNGKKNKVNFTPAAPQQEVPLPEVQTTTVDTPSAHPKLQDYLTAIPSNDTTLDFSTFDALRNLSTADSVATARLLITDHGHCFNAIRLLHDVQQPLTPELEYVSTTLVLCLTALTAIPTISLSPAVYRPDRFQFEFTPWSPSMLYPNIVHKHALLLHAYDLLRPFFAFF